MRFALRSCKVRAAACTLAIAAFALPAPGAEQPRVRPTFDYNELKSFAELTNSIREISQRLDAAEKALGSNNTNVAKLLSDLAGAYDDMGDSARALDLDERCLSILEGLLGPEDKQVADTVNDLAWEYEQIGDYEEALPLFERSLAVTEKLLGPEHFEAATTLGNLADLYREMGDYTHALPLCRRALEIRQKVLGPEHPDLTDSLDSLAQILRGLGACDEALAACRRSLAIGEKTLGSDSPLVAEALFVMGGVRADLGDYPEALSAYQRALAIDEKISGPDHPDVIEILEGLSVLSARRHNWEQSLATAVELCRRQQRHLVGQAVALADTVALRCLHASFESSEVLHSLCGQAPARGADASWRFGAEALALSKAFLEEVRAAQAAFEADTETSTRALREQYRAVQLHLERLARDERNTGRRESLRRDLQSQLSQTEQQLSERSHLLAQTLRDRTLSLSDIARGLPPRAALADFIQYRRYDFTAKGTNQWKEQCYAVYLTRPLAPDSTNAVVERVDLGAAAPINEAVELICRRTSAGQYAAKDLPPTLQRVSGLVYGPLASHLANVSHLIVCPDGQLSRLPFEMLSHEGRFLIEDKTLSYVGSGREIARLTGGPKTKVQSSAPLVMGNPDFDLDLSSTAVAAARRRSSEPGAAVPQPAGLALTRTLSRDYRGMGFKPLPGAEVEARSVAKLLGQDTVLRIGPDAREAELKLVASPRVLHLATHGFFLSDQEFKRTSRLTTNSPPAGGFAHQIARGGDWENPLVRCGIALAGANHAKNSAFRTPDSEIEDGLLTGLEASLLNLQGTELVILSACDSGAGEVRTGEGVMSLRRAFRIAGAETVLASHWKVNDAATRRLMTEFIGRWRSGEPRAKSWRQAQLSLLHSKDFSNPYFWAAFTLTGDWR